MKKSKEVMQIQVGAFVTIGLVLLMVVLFLLGSEKKLFERSYTLVYRSPNISGIGVGASVKVAGIRVGSVHEIGFDKPDDKKVKVVLRISKKYQSRIRKDSVASVQGQGLLGDKMIQITVGSSDEDELKDGDEIPEAVRGGGMDDLEGTLKKADITLSKLNKVLDEINEGEGLLHEIIYEGEGRYLLDDLREVMRQLASTGRSVSSVMGKVDQGIGTLGALVNDASLYNDIKTLLGKANRNKLIRAVIRYTLKTKEENLLED